MAMPGPRFFGFVIGGGLPAAVAADWLTIGLGPERAVRADHARRRDRRSGRRRVAGRPVRPPARVVRRVRDRRRRWPTSPAWPRRVTPCSGARGWDVEANGLQGAPRITVVVGADAHVTVFAALRMLGLGAGTAVRVEVDGEGRMRAGRAARNACGRLGPDDRLSPGRQREQRGLGSAGRGDRGRPRAWRGLDPRRRCLRALGCGPPGAAPPGRRTRRRGFVVHRRAQVAQRAVRLRARRSSGTPRRIGRRWA